MRVSLLVTVISLVLFSGTIADAAVLVKPVNNLGMVGYWSFDDASGTRLGDASGRGMHGTVTQGAGGWTAGVRGNTAYSFDGSATYVDMPVASQPQLGTSQTVSLWFMYSSLPSGAQNLMSRDTGGGGSFIGIHDLSGCSGFSLGAWNFAGPFVVCTSLPSVNTWHHLVYTYDGTTNVLYVDGSVASSSTTNVNIGTVNNFDIGRYVGGNEYFQGKIDDVRIYNRALTAAEISSLYRNGASRMGRSSALLGSGGLNFGLIGHWTFDGVDTNWTANTTADRTGGSSGRMVNLATSTTPVSGAIGQAFNIRGKNNYVRVASTSALVLNSGAFSVAGWIKSTSTATQMIAFHGLGCSTFANWWLSIGGNEGSNAANKFAFGFNTSNNGGTTQNVSTAGNASTSRWVHVVGTYNGSSQLSIYVDGVLQNTASVSGNPYASFEHLYLGADPGCSGRFPVQGLIDDVRVYNRLLTATDVKQLYGLGGQKLNTPSQSMAKGSLNTGLQMHYTFDGKDIGAFVYDKSGSGDPNNNFVIFNAATSSMVTFGKIGQALSFDGVNDRVLNHSTSVSIGTVHSTSLWINFTDTGDGVVLGTSAGDYQFYLDQTDVYYNASGSFVSVPHGDMSGWVHLGVVRNNTSVTFYKNGQQLGSTQTLGGNTPSGIASIGSYSNGTFPMRGKLDDIRVYTRAITAAEMKQLYNLGK